MTSKVETFKSILGVILCAGALFQIAGPSAGPEVADGPVQAGIMQSCAPGSRTGNADRDVLETPAGLKITVRSPGNYDATRAYPLIVAFPPAGVDREAAERFYDITTEATRLGYLVAYSDHVRLSRAAVVMQASVAATVLKAFCVDTDRIAFLGHSDGGAMSEGLPVFAEELNPRPHVIVASAAGISKADISSAPCPPVHAVMIVHNREDHLFPDYGRDMALYWGKCASCNSAAMEWPAAGCRDLPDCRAGRRVAYCESSSPHSRWPKMNTQILDFINQGLATCSTRISRTF